MDSSSSGQLPSQEPEAGKYFIESAENVIDRGSPIPDAYGDNRIVIMPRDPLWFFAYWEVTGDRLNQVRREHGALLDQAESILRVYDVTHYSGEDFSGRPAFDVSIPLEARRFYVQVPQTGRTYCVDLGFKLRDGRFISLLRSNRITLPKGQISEETDSQWMAVGTREEWDRLFDESAHKVGRGSAESSKGMALRWEFLKSVFSASSSRLSQPSSGKLPTSTTRQEVKR